MLGALIGDIVGSRFEFNNHRSKNFELFAKDSFVTDDTIMSLAIAKALIETGKHVKSKSNKYYELLEANSIKYMQSIGRKYPNCGYGGRFQVWMFDDNPKPYNSYGNGSAMRISPVAWVANNESELKKLSQVVTGVTHNHPEGLKGAEAVALAIFLSRKGYYKQEIKDRIEQDYYILDFTINRIRKSYAFNETCQDTVPQALQAFFESDSFEDAIRTAISVGGDSDTLAAITGSIAEAYYGVPKHIERESLSFLDNKLTLLYEEWIEFINKQETLAKYHVITKYIPFFESNLLRDENYDIYTLPKEYHYFFNDLWSIQKANDSFINHDVLTRLGIQWKQSYLIGLDINNLNEDELIYIMTRLHSTERIHGGTVVYFIKNGYYLAWLKRLKEISESK
jgi:ADP-ribosylglycohydrolase